VASGVRMRISRNLTKQIAASVVLFLVPGAALSAVAQQTQTSQVQDATAASVSQNHQTDLPDSPGASLARLQPPILPNSSQASGAAAAPGSPQQSQPSDQQPPSQDVQSAPQKPVGTAAAEPTHAAGVAASQPAGVAVAPAKQRRARTIVIRVGALVGAGVAVGTIAALTLGTSSRPPGAH